VFNKKGSNCSLFYCWKNVLLIHYVHGYFKTKTHFSCWWWCPHDHSPYKLILELAFHWVFDVASSLKTLCACMHIYMLFVFMNAT